MHLPYTDRYPEAIAIASQSLAVSLTAVLWSRPLPRRTSNVLFAASLWGTALTADLPGLGRWLRLTHAPPTLLWLQGTLGLATLAVVLSGPTWLRALALVGQVALFGLGSWVTGSGHELMFAHFMQCALLLGAHALVASPRRARAPEPLGPSFLRQDAAIFLFAFALAVFVNTRVFEWVIFNGDEVANSFQADLYAHFKAYATPRPCQRSFENYWVLPYQGRLFSQYTPGWPLFMAPFQRLGVIGLAGPVAAGLLAVGVARLSRRAARGLGSSSVETRRIVSVAGPLGGIFVILGPSALLNGASRFSHTLVALCFAWAVEGAALVATPGLSRRQAFGHGMLLGGMTALGIATRPADGGMLSVGILFYFVIALFSRRVSLHGLLGTALAFTLVGGLTLVILRLQVGVWFRTGYSVTPLIHPEGKLVLSAPTSSELKYGIPLATGSYCWWPVAPALGLGGLVRCLRGSERRIAFMLVVSSLFLTGFYSLVTFGRGGDDGLGPRYHLPLVVTQATGTAVLLGPLLARLFHALRAPNLALRARLGLAAPGVLMLAAAVIGTSLIVPLTYPVAYAEHHESTGPLRAARKLRLKNAVVLLEPNHLPQHETNLAQNAPMDPSPDVLFLIRHGPADDACIRTHYPGRTWYRAGLTDKLTPIAPR